MRCPQRKKTAGTFRPLEHGYHWYNARREANAEWMGAKQGIHDFLRAYFHVKSADWKGNNPFPLQAFSATELVKMPRYYIMDLDKTMPENVAPDMPTPEEIAANTWLTDEELRVYSSEFGRTSFQGGLNAYRLQTDPSFSAELLSSAIILSSRSRQLSGKSTYVSQGLRECSPAAHMSPFSQLLPAISSNTVKMLIGWPGIT